MKNTRILARVAVCIAAQVVLARFLAISTPVLRVSFEFIPAALVALLYGPWWAMGACVCADVLGALLFPSGAFFPGFTLSAALTGLTLGVFLFPCRRQWRRIVPACAVCTLLINIGLGTYWLTLLLDKGFLVMLPGRVAKNLVMLPVMCLVIRVMARWAPRLDRRR